MKKPPLPRAKGYTAVKGGQNAHRKRRALCRVLGLASAVLVVVVAVLFALLWKFTSFNLIDCIGSRTNCGFTPSLHTEVISIPASHVVYSITSVASGNPNNLRWVMSDGVAGYVNYLSVTPVFTTPFTTSPTQPTAVFPSAFSFPEVGLVFASSFPTPTQDQSPMVFAVTATVVSALTFATNINNPLLAALEVGFDPEFQKLTWLSNTPGQANVTFQGVAAGPFHPSKLVNWVPDARMPLFAAQPLNTFHNVYAPSTVWTGGRTWIVYYGGQDLNVDVEFDSIYRTTTTDGFVTFGPRSVQVAFSPLSNLVVSEVNNPTVIPLASNNWYMMTTQQVYMPQLNRSLQAQTYTWPYINKPGVAWSTNGVVWTPSIGTLDDIITMDGYPLDYTIADMNGANVPYYNGNSFEMYFMNQNEPTATLNYATSPNGVNWTWVKNFSITDPVYLAEGIRSYAAPNCIRSYTFNGMTYFFTVYIRLTPVVWYTLSMGSLANSPGIPQNPLFYSIDYTYDYYVDTATIVDNTTHLFGVLYGSGSINDDTVRNNTIFGRWLQRSPQLNGQPWQRGSAVGLDTVVIPSPSLLTTSIALYDSDNATVLWNSPRITLVPGDRFQLHE